MNLKAQIMLGKLNRFATLLPTDPGAGFKHWDGKQKVVWSYSEPEEKEVTQES